MDAAKLANVFNNYKEFVFERLYFTSDIVNFHNDIDTFELWYQKISDYITTHPDYLFISKLDSIITMNTIFEDQHLLYIDQDEEYLEDMEFSKSEYHDYMVFYIMSTIDYGLACWIDTDDLKKLHSNIDVVDMNRIDDYQFLMTYKSNSNYRDIINKFKETSFDTNFINYL